MRLDDFTVPDKNLIVSVQMEFKTQDVGVQTSSTDSAHQGIKPKQVSVSLFITFKDEKLLTSLTSVAEALKADGSRFVYTIADTTCNAMKIRQVQFSETLNVQEHDTLMGWKVSFTLVEYNSVPEKTENRTPTAVTQVQTAKPTDDGEEPKQFTATESFLSKLDNMLK